ncbi:MAG: hypothetical protein WAJ94_10585 [Candidatus Cybelea sp.]
MRLRADLLADFPEWFTLRGHAGVFRIDPVRSAYEGAIVLADIGGREVGRCSVDELRESLYEAA